MKGRRFPGRRAGPAILLSASGTGAASGGVFGGNQAAMRALAGDMRAGKVM